MRTWFQWLTLLAIVSALLLTGLPALAGTPPEVLDQSVTEANQWTDVNNSTRYIAQVFTAGKTGTLTKAALYLSAPSDASSVTFQLRSVDPATGTPTAQVLAATTIGIAQLPTNRNRDWVTIPFASPATVVAGTRYALVAAMNGGGLFHWNFGYVEPTAVNAAFGSGDGTGWGTLFVVNALPANASLLFQTYVTITDSTAPVITPAVTGTLGQDGWYTGDVAVAWTVKDAESAVTASTGCDATSITADTSGTTLTCTATSLGGTATQSVTITRDATAPALAPGVAPNPIVLGGNATATANATDAMSGIAAQSCDPLDTGSVGAKSVACTATDAAGNTATAQANYTVTYAFEGFASPVDMGMLNIAKAGKAIPLKFRLTDANGAPVTTVTTAAITSVSLNCGSLGIGSDALEEYAAAASGVQNLGNGYYQINWKAPSGYAGSCRQLRLDLGDGLSHTADFQFIK